LSTENEGDALGAEPTLGGVRLSVLGVLGLLLLDLALLLARAVEIETNHAPTPELTWAFGVAVTATVAALTFSVHSGNGAK
jgi:hypothetical protein